MEAGQQAAGKRESGTAGMRSSSVMIRWRDGACGDYEAVDAVERERVGGGGHDAGPLDGRMVGLNWWNGPQVRRVRR